MPMPRRLEQVVVWEVRLSIRTAAYVELLLLDPMTQHAKQGIRTKLVEQLLNEWLSTMIQKKDA